MTEFNQYQHTKNGRVYYNSYCKPCNKAKLREYYEKKKLLNQTPMPLPNYLTSDLPLASALMCAGYKVENVDNNSPRAVFTFVQNESLGDTVQEYFQGQMRVEPLAFFNNMRTLKRRIYNN